MLLFLTCQYDFFFQFPDSFSYSMVLPGSVQPFSYFYFYSYMPPFSFCYLSCTSFLLEWFEQFFQRRRVGWKHVWGCWLVQKAWRWFPSVSQHTCLFHLSTCGLWNGPHWKKLPYISPITYYLFPFFWLSEIAERLVKSSRARRWTLGMSDMPDENLIPPWVFPDMRLWAYEGLITALTSWWIIVDNDLPWRPWFTVKIYHEDLPWRFMFQKHVSKTKG